MPEDGFVSVTVPEDLWTRLKRLPLRRLGFETPTGFVRDLLSKKCEELEAEGSGRRG